MKQESIELSEHMRDEINISGIFLDYGLINLHLNANHNVMV